MSTGQQQLVPVLSQTNFLENQPVSSETPAFLSSNSEIPSSSLSSHIQPFIPLQSAGPAAGDPVSNTSTSAGSDFVSLLGLPGVPTTTITSATVMAINQNTGMAGGRPHSSSISSQSSVHPFDGMPSGGTGDFSRSHHHIPDHSPQNSLASSNSFHSRNASLSSTFDAPPPSNNSVSPPSSHSSPDAGSSGKAGRKHPHISGIRKARTAAGPYVRPSSHAGSDRNSHSPEDAFAPTPLWDFHSGQPGFAEDMSANSSADESGEDMSRSAGRRDRSKMTTATTTGHSSRATNIAVPGAPDNPGWWDGSTQSQVQGIPVSMQQGNQHPLGHPGYPPSIPGMVPYYGSSMLSNVSTVPNVVGVNPAMMHPQQGPHLQLPESHQIMLNSFASHRNYNPRSNSLAGGLNKLTLLPGGKPAGPGMYFSAAGAKLGVQASPPQTREEALQSLAHTMRHAVTTTAQERARQAFVQAWLVHSYIANPDGNVSRQGLYGSYLRVCDQYGVKHINSASFGKAVRSAFPNIKTRRLGVRGNSKYHYCGIRPATIKEAEILNALSRSDGSEDALAKAESAGEDDGREESELLGSDLKRQMSAPNLEQMASGAGSEFPQTPTTARPKPGDPSLGITSPPARPASRRRHTTSTLGPDTPPVGENMEGILHKVPPQPTTRIISFPNIEEVFINPGLPAEIDGELAKHLWAQYAEHCQNLLETVRGLRFDQFELHIRSFWGGLEEPARRVIQYPAIANLIYRADAIVYDEILEFFHTQTLQPLAPQAFASLRQLADNMEQIIIVSMPQPSFAQTFVGPKIELAARFGHLLIRHLGVCQLAQALIGIISNPVTVKDMAEAWDAIDFEAVRNQAALVTNCQHDTLTSCFQDFKRILCSPNYQIPIETLINWADSTFERCLHPSASESRGISPRSLLVRWNFVATQLMRDLTLRSSPTFGNFQIISLFFEDWLGFQVLRKVALQISAINASIDIPKSAGGAAAGPQLAHNPIPTSQQQQAMSSMDDFLNMPLLSPNTQAAFAQYTAGASAAGTTAQQDHPTHTNTLLTSSLSTDISSSSFMPMDQFGPTFSTTSFGSPLTDLFSGMGGNTSTSGPSSSKPSPNHVSPNSTGKQALGSSATVSPESQGRPIASPDRGSRGEGVVPMEES